MIRVLIENKFYSLTYFNNSLQYIPFHLPIGFIILPSDNLKGKGG